MSSKNWLDDAIIESYDQAKRVLWAMLNTPASRINALDAIGSADSVNWGLPVLMRYGPGAAKTAAVKEYARRYVLPSGQPQPLLTLSPGARGDGGFGMIPMPSKAEDGRTTVWDFPPFRDVVETWSRSDGVGVVLCDDIVNASETQMRAMYDFLLEKRIGSYTLPRGVATCGATNSVDESVGGLEIPAGVANRLGHLPWVSVPPSAWATFMSAGASFDVPDAFKVDVVRHRQYVAAEAARLYVDEVKVAAGYYSSKGTMRSQPDVSSPQASRAWLSERTAEFAVYARCGALANGLSESDADVAAALFVGNAVTCEMAAYKKSMDLPSVEDFLQSCVAGSPCFVHRRARADRTFAVLAGVTTYLTAKAKCDLVMAEKLARAFWVWVGQNLATDAADMIQPFVQALQRVPAQKTVNLCRVVWPEVAQAFGAMKNVWIDDQLKALPPPPPSPFPVDTI